MRLLCWILTAQASAFSLLKSTPTSNTALFIDRSNWEGQVPPPRASFERPSYRRSTDSTQQPLYYNNDDNYYYNDQQQQYYDNTFDYRNTGARDYYDDEGSYRSVIPQVNTEETTNSRGRTVPYYEDPFYDNKLAQEMDVDQSVNIQGGSLRTYSFDEFIDRSELYLATEGRPLNGVVELWHGPDNTPQKCKFYSEDGNVRPIRLFVETPGSDNAVCLRNNGTLEFPISAWITPEVTGMAVYGNQKTIQGGALHTFPFDVTVRSVQVLIETDGRPLNCRIELMQGPNNSKQLMEVYTEDGLKRPFFCIIETPGSNNVVRVLNTAAIEFPMHAVVEPYEIDEYNELTGGWDRDVNENKWDVDPAENMQEMNAHKEYVPFQADSSVPFNNRPIAPQNEYNGSNEYNNRRNDGSYRNRL